jgi:hypothetical protein
MNKFLYVVMVAGIAGSFATAHARNGADNAPGDLQGHGQDLVLKRNGADNAAGDLRGRAQDLILKRNGADNAPGDLRGRANDLILKRQGADDPAGHIRRAQGADDLHMQHARNHR